MVPNGKEEAKLEEMGIIKIIVNIGKGRWQLVWLQRASSLRKIVGSVSWEDLWGMIPFINAFYHLGHMGQQNVFAIMKIVDGTVKSPAKE